MAHIKADREPRAGEKKIRAELYLRGDTLAKFDRRVEMLPGISTRNGGFEYLVEFYEARQAAWEAKGGKGPVPLYEPGDLIV